jgi:hypothetical protein
MSDKIASFERLLSTSLQRTIDFVKFAEAKNAALLTFCSGWIVALVSLLTKDKGLPQEYQNFMLAALPLFSISALLCITSFLPVSLTRFYRDADGAKSLLYFKDIASFKAKEFRDRVRERYLPVGGDDISKHYLDDLAIQIAVNSAIATRKFSTFNIAALIVVAAMTVLSVPLAKWLYAFLSLHGFAVLPP